MGGHRQSDSVSLALSVATNTTETAEKSNFSRNESWYSDGRPLTRDEFYVRRLGPAARTVQKLRPSTTRNTELYSRYPPPPRRYSDCSMTERPASAYMPSVLPRPPTEFPPCPIYGTLPNPGMLPPFGPPPTRKQQKALKKEMKKKWRSHNSLFIPPQFPMFDPNMGPPVFDPNMGPPVFDPNMGPPSVMHPSLMRHSAIYTNEAIYGTIYRPEPPAYYDQRPPSAFNPIYGIVGGTARHQSMEREPIYGYVPPSGQELPGIYSAPTLPQPPSDMMDIRVPPIGASFTTNVASDASLMGGKSAPKGGSSTYSAVDASCYEKALDSGFFSVMIIVVSIVVVGVISAVVLIMTL